MFSCRQAEIPAFCAAVILHSLRVDDLGWMSLSKEEKKARATRFLSEQRVGPKMSMNDVVGQGFHKYITPFFEDGETVRLGNVYYTVHKEKPYHNVNSGNEVMEVSFVRRGKDGTK